MAVSDLVLRISYAWWVIPYLRACMLFARLTGMEPDCDKVSALLMRGVKFRMEAKG
ncbi:hypothetical protein D9M71_33890 [compost metagenome]